MISPATAESLAEDVAGEVLRIVASRRRPRGSTYRWQFHAKFTFRDATALVPYLHALGITHVYASPYLKAMPGSQHGYDVCKHDELNPELGSAEDYAALVATLQQHEMGQILDVVPNHMAASQENPWWQDVLENGPVSPYAHYFDIDWHPVKDELESKVLLPILGQQFGDALESGELQLAHSEGGFFLRYFDRSLPIGPKSAIDLLVHRLDELRTALGETSDAFGEYQSVITALEHLPPKSATAPEFIAERQREKEVIKRRLRRLETEQPLVEEFIARNIQEFNGQPGNPQSFDRLEALLATQAYRLCHWKAASDEVNYRRFFEVNALAALCVEAADVFKDAHRMVLDLAARGDIDGLRIDHIDGLFEPTQYLWRLQGAFLERLGEQVFRERTSVASPVAEASSGATFTTDEAVSAQETVDQTPTWDDVRPILLDLLRQRFDLQRPDRATSSGMDGATEAPASSPPDALPLYVLVEKILGPDEPLPETWPVAGTTGYDFLHQLNGLFLDPQGVSDIKETYARFTDVRTDYADIVYRCKVLILRVAMSSELQMLAHRLNRISEQHRRSRDFTLNSLRHALREILALFPVYRTYPGPDGISDRDRHFINFAIAQAKRRNPVIDAALFDFVRNVLLLNHPEGISEAACRDRELFTGRFQQVTSPVMAKGVEDTAFYVYFPLVSMNDVGCHPESAVVPSEQFHRENAERRRLWPQSMLCTTSHDTKRTEDVRARINVLAELPHLWRKAVNHWARLNRRLLREVDGLPAPSRNDEYLFYQTLVGVWPAEPASAGIVSKEEHEQLITRLQGYMEKATHEAKSRTSWINPDTAYDEAVRQFVAATLEPRADNKFLVEFKKFHESILDGGLYNALSQVVLKLMSPGIPDIYQGQEAWDFSLVDPDNRRPVDYDRRREWLAELQATVAAGPQAQFELAQRLGRSPRDPRLKLFITWQLLQLRRAHTELFAHGVYQSLEVQGEAARHVCAFEWRGGGSAAESSSHGFIVVVPRFLTQLRAAAVEPIWGNTEVVLSAARPRRWRNVFTAAELDHSPSLPLQRLLADFPIAVLAAVS